MRTLRGPGVRVFVADGRPSDSSERGDGRSAAGPSYRRALPSVVISRTWPTSARCRQRTESAGPCAKLSRSWVRRSAGTSAGTPESGRLHDGVHSQHGRHGSRHLLRRQSRAELRMTTVRLARHLIRARRARSFVPAVAAAQTGTIVGRVVAKGANAPDGLYRRLGETGRSRAIHERRCGDSPSVVCRRASRGEREAHWVRAIRHHRRACSAGDTVRLTIELSLVTIQLPAIQSLAKACGHPGAPDTATNLQLAMLFDQLKMNAERHALLSRSYPFELRVERKLTKPEPAIEARFVAFDTVARSSLRDWRYAPGNVMGDTRNRRRRVRRARGSPSSCRSSPISPMRTFIMHHCFDFGGSEVVDGDTLIRIDFVPAPSVHDPDVAGAVFLDRTSFQLRRMQVNLVNLTKAASVADRRSVDPRRIRRSHSLGFRC